MEQLLREFLAEAEDLIEALFRDTEALREKRDEGRARRELVGRIFRHVHTLKGTAAAAGLELASHLAHEFETLLDAVRENRVRLSDVVLDAFEDAAHALSQTLDAAARGVSAPPVLPLLETLQRLAQGNDDEQPPPHPASAKTLVRLPEALGRVLGSDEARRLHEAAAEGQRLFIVNVTFDLETFDLRFRELSAALCASGELISTLPGQAEAAPGAINLCLLYASQSPASAVELSALASTFGSVSMEELKVETIAGNDESAARLEAGRLSGRASDEKIGSPSTQVRVELGRLDELVAGAHELMIETARVLELALADTVVDAVREEVKARAARLHEHFIKLEEQLIGLRRVPLERTLERVARAGRLAARSTGKNVAFELAGGDVRLDKSLVEAISDPLLHLVRNAIDHGIETPRERLDKGKRERSTVRLDARARGDRVSLKIADDGRGINLDGVARAAVERGIIRAGQNVSRQQALRLIFRPGFSTSAEASKMSGRGVGLDIVERAIEQVGGEMHVWSETGQGTTFELIVPVALALLNVRVVSSAGFHYCIDAQRVGELGLAAAVDVTRAGEQELIDWHGAHLPLVRLRKLLGHPPAEESVESLSVIIMSPPTVEDAEEAGGRVAVVVDRWQEEPAEVLVRRLGAHGVCWPGIAGAVELSDGQLALVLDLPKLLEPHRATRVNDAHAPRV
jgi:two-component system chemotaxis sensor kinase CheA